MSGNQSLGWGERARRFVDRTTTYRLMLYYLLVLFVAALLFGIARVLPYGPLTLLWSAAVLLVVTGVTNTLLSRIFRATTNTESVYITALILVFLMSPVAFTDVRGSILLALVGVFAMASKYLLAIRKKHLFNPAAFAVAASALLLGVPPAWWAGGTPALVPLIVLGGLVVVYKLRRFDVILSFAAAIVATTLVTSPDPVTALGATLAYSSIFFFVFVMLVEPLTMPSTRTPRIIYSALVGTLFVWAPSIGPLSVSSEVALLLGNVFAFITHPAGRYALSFVERRPLAPGIYEYRFKSNRPVNFVSGQYLEWTLAGVPADSRGNRRYFTIASAPEDETLALGVRFYEKPSAFKRTLANLPTGARVSATSVAGDFTMPQDKNKKLAFLAGGIGVTPFASMTRHMIRARERRDAVLLYSAKTEGEVAYRDVFLSAAAQGLRTSYIVGEILNADRIKSEIPDYAGRLFYLSGPPGFVDAMKRELGVLGVSRINIKTDFFPGLAA